METSSLDQSDLPDEIRQEIAGFDRVAFDVPGRLDQYWELCKKIQGALNRQDRTTEDPSQWFDDETKSVIDHLALYRYRDVRHRKKLSAFQWLASHKNSNWKLRPHQVIARFGPNISEGILTLLKSISNTISFSEAVRRLNDQRHHRLAPVTVKSGVSKGETMKNKVKGMETSNGAEQEEGGDNNEWNDQIAERHCTYRRRDFQKVQAALAKGDNSPPEPDEIGEEVHYNTSHVNTPEVGRGGLEYDSPLNFSTSHDESTSTDLEHRESSHLNDKPIHTVAKDFSVNTVQPTCAFDQGISDHGTQSASVGSNRSASCDRSFTETLHQGYRDSSPDQLGLHVQDESFSSLTLLQHYDDGHDNDGHAQQQQQHQQEQPRRTNTSLVPSTLIANKYEISVGRSAAHLAVSLAGSSPASVSLKRSADATSPGDIQPPEREAKRPRNTGDEQGKPENDRDELWVTSFSGKNWLLTTAIEKSLRLLNPDPRLYLLVQDISISTTSSGFFEDPRIYLRRYRSHHYLLVVMNIDENHWTIGIIEVHQRQLVVFDPLHVPENVKAAERALRIIAEELDNIRALDAQKEWIVREVEEQSLKQCDTHSCGVYVIMFGASHMAGKRLTRNRPDLWRELLGAVFRGSSSASVPSEDISNVGEPVAGPRSALSQSIDTMSRTTPEAPVCAQSRDTAWGLDIFTDVCDGLLEPRLARANTLDETAIGLEEMLAIISTIEAASETTATKHVRLREQLSRLQVEHRRLRHEQKAALQVLNEHSPQAGQLTDDTAVHASNEIIAIFKEYETEIKETTPLDPAQSERLSFVLEHIRATKGSVEQERDDVDMRLSLDIDVLEAFKSNSIWEAAAA